MFLKEDQIKNILSNAPTGADKTKILDELVRRGYELENVNMEKARERLSGLDQPRIEQEEGDFGTGFTPTVQSKEDDSLFRSGIKTLRNAPKSAFELGKNVVSAVVNPIDTAKSVGRLIRGAGAKVGEVALERTDIGQSLLERQNRKRVEAGLPRFERDAEGRLQAPENEDLQAINTLGSFVNERYGSIDKFRESAVEDPVGVLADIAGVLTGTGAVVRGVGQASKLGAVSKAGQAVGAVGRSAEPLNVVGSAVSKTIGAGGKALGTAGKVAGDIAGDVIPSSRKSIVGALELTPQDVVKIEQKTGQSVDKFILDRGFTGRTAEEIAQNLNDFRKVTDAEGELVGGKMFEVRNAINQVDNVYGSGDVPRVQQALNTLDELYGDQVGLEGVQAEIRQLIGKDEYTLADIQKTKELLDDADIIFRESGETKAGVKSKGLANVREEIRGFIEDEVAKKFPDTDIRALNNEVATSRELEKAILNRSTKDLTRNQIGLTDWIVGSAVVGGAATGGLSLPVAAGIFITKKAIESPAFRISLAKTLSKIEDSKIKSLLDKVNSGKSITSQENRLIRDIIQDAKEASGVTFPVFDTVEEVEEITTDGQ